MEAALGETCKEQIILSRKELFVIIKDEIKNGSRNIINHLEVTLSRKSGSTVQIRNHMKPVLSSLFNKMKNRWQTARRSKVNFLKKNKEWLDITVSFPVVTTHKNKGGRPSEEFTSSSGRTKRRRTEEIRTNLPSSELTYALQMNLRSEGRLDASKIVKDGTSSPLRAPTDRSAHKSSVETPLSEDTALSILIESKLSESQYEVVRSACVENNCQLYPPYKNVVRAKKRCYPPKTTITITKSSAEVELQALLDHTLNRIILLKNDVIRSVNVSHMELICKWGCGESSGHSEYQQNLSDNTDPDVRASCTSVVPLQLVCVDHESNRKVIVWENPWPSSPRFCRIQRMQFHHENECTTTVNRIQRVEEQIQSLVPFTTVVNAKEISITFKMEHTTVDDEVCNAVSSSESAHYCYLCGATSEDFNKIDAILEKDIRASDIWFGLSTSHLWIRFFECCLHLSYKLDVIKREPDSEDEEQITADRKTIVQKEFGAKLGLDIDPETGYGSINNDRAARYFFKNSSTSAAITGINEDLIKRFLVILQAISSGHVVNCEKFNEYALETGRKFVELYPWYRMPTSVHKLLIHGPQIIASALLPIGQLSRQVHREYIKRFHEEFSPIGTRGKTMLDIFNHRLVISDPYISSIRKLPCKRLKSLTPETVELLLLPKATTSTGTTANHVIDTDSDAGSDSNEDSESEFDSE